ncbi:MAG: hypothetical protein Q9170_005256 [Blastenia crenularia]
MPILPTRSNLTDNASAKASSGWHNCMSKSYCKYPAIIGIILALLVFVTCTYLLFRFLSCCCCDCLSGGRYRRSSRKHKYADLGASPYTGYPNHGPSNTEYGEPPRYAQFEYSSSGRKGGDDSLPRMPVWGEAGQKRVFEHERELDGEGKGVREEKEVQVELKREQRVPMLGMDPAPGYEEVDKGLAGGDLGYEGGYKSYGAAYVPYSANAARDGEGREEKGWRDV